MNLAVVRLGSEGNAVLVADELGEFGVDGTKILGIGGEVGAPSGRVRELTKKVVGFSELVFWEGLGGGGFLFVFWRRAQIGGERDCKEANVTGAKLRESGTGFVGRGCINSGGEKHDCFFALRSGKPTKDLQKTRGEVEGTKAKVVMQRAERGGSKLLVGRKVKNPLRFVRILDDRDTVGRR